MPPPATARPGDDPSVPVPAAGRDEEAVPEPPADATGETGEGGSDGPSYDEEQWQRSIDESLSMAAAGDLPADDEPSSGEPPATGPMPELEELLKKIPASSQELIRAEFSGRFRSVRVIDRKKLY